MVCQSVRQMLAPLLCPGPEFPLTLELSRLKIHAHVQNLYAWRILQNLVSEQWFENRPVFFKAVALDLDEMIASAEGLATRFNGVAATAAEFARLSAPVEEDETTNPENTRSALEATVAEFAKFAGLSKSPTSSPSQISLDEAYAQAGVVAAERLVEHLASARSLALAATGKIKEALAIREGLLREATQGKPEPNGEGGKADGYLSKGVGAGKESLFSLLMSRATQKQP